METYSTERIILLIKPNANELYLEMIANMKNFKEYSIKTQNPWVKINIFRMF